MIVGYSLDNSTPEEDEDRRRIAFRMWLIGVGCIAFILMYVFDSYASFSHRVQRAVAQVPQAV
jgi:hypothetical protein